MWKNGKIFDAAVLNNIFLSRASELFFAAGIPMVAFISLIDDLSLLKRLLWLLPLLLLTGRHIITVNDFCFDKKINKEKLKKPEVFFPIFIIPCLPVLFFLSLKHFLLIFILLIIIINWDIYSFFGKRHWFSGLLHNFLGGMTHYLAGAAGADVKDWMPLCPAFLFFAFAMTGGAMHHDALDVNEDCLKGYKTGAVRFGADRWWRLGVIPLLLSQIFLIYTTKLFSLTFGAASVLYFAVYIYAASQKQPSTFHWFRISSRLIFGLGAMIFIILSLIQQCGKAGY